MSRTVLTPRRPWNGRRVVLGVTGGIAAYKSVQLARDLTRLGARVEVILTPGAQRFVGALSFEGVTGGPVHSELLASGPQPSEAAALHIRLGREADVVVVAPATAELIAKAAHGRADDLLTTTLLVTRAPVLLCPAMNDRMFAHEQVQANLAHCRDGLGYRIAGPATGPLAAGEAEGAGRMLEPQEIVEHVGRALGESASWTAKTVLITAGPTREPVDAVRYVGNRSSGRMGYALAAAAWRMGARVVLVSGPSSLTAPVGVELHRVQTAVEMNERVSALLPSADVAVFAAAVADYRPESPKAGKVKRSETGTSWSIDLVTNPDVALETRASRKPGSVAVGFALETHDLLANAKRKLDAKGFDLLVANDASEAGAGFEVETNRVTILAKDGTSEALDLMSKDDVALEILDRVTPLLGG
jgi:phosphopantothenoylcysteine decarboxylase / phosphopantothenate---cysteine ligase